MFCEFLLGMDELLPTSRLPSTVQISKMEGGKYTSDEEPERSLCNGQKMAAELLGTYIIVLIGCGSIYVDQRSHITLVGIAIVWSGVVTAMVYTLGHLSGGHFNPAVTIAFAVVGQFPWKKVPLYMVVQVLGGILAGFTLRCLFHGERADLMVSFPFDSVNDLDAFVWEFIIAFILMFVICGTATDQRAIKELSGVAVGVTVFFNAIIAGKITGASMNPARSIGPAIATLNFHKLWIYIGAPVSGAITGSTIYHLLSVPSESLRKIGKNIKKDLEPESKCSG